MTAWRWRADEQEFEENDSREDEPQYEPCPSLGDFRYDFHEEERDITFFAEDAPDYPSCPEPRVPDYDYLFDEESDEDDVENENDPITYVENEILDDPSLGEDYPEEQDDWDADDWEWFLMGAEPPEE